MKPPKKIYAKVAVGKNGEEFLRLSTSPFLNGNIVYVNACVISGFIPVREALPATNNVGRCPRKLEVLDKYFKKHEAWYGVAGWYRTPVAYAEYEIKDVIAWRYND